MDKVEGARVEFRVLGPLEVVRDGAPVDLGGAKQRAVLAALLTERGRVVGAERLADLVWDGTPPAAAATTLRAYISNLRKALRPADVLLTRAQGYVLDVPAEAVDVARFEAVAAEGRKALAGGEDDRARSLLTEANELWRGRAYEDFAYASFVQGEVSRLAELRLNCLEDLIECRLALGEHAELTGELEALTASHPMRERLWAARMTALYRSGRQGDSLKVYEEARTTLAEELGIDPSPELRRLHESILRQDGELAVSVPRARPGKQTLSFLFTDIELSTEMLLGAEDEYAYAQTMEEHRAALRDAFTSHGGQRIRTWGDAFFSAFDTATDAVRAAIAAQVALIETCPEGVRVRMGVHSGEAAVVAEDYVGIAVHAAARIQAAAHGGQVLVSQSTKELLDADVGEGVTFLDLGPHQLKDIPEPLRLFQLTHPNLPRSFPPPRTMSALPHNLPASAKSFVGRQDDVREIAHALENARVVTLTGVGGVGKTRLSLETGAEVLPRYPNGVWFCELAAITDLDGIIHTIARALRFDREGSRTFRESLIAFLRQQRSLLLLDNCEHLLEPAAELIEEIARSCPTVAVLATSREGIGVDGEHIRPVRSLGVPADDAACETIADADAVRLFVDRARAVRPDFELGPHNAAAVTGICRRLDGIPLAIELAAARVTSMGPLEIAARLDRDFRFLRSGRRTAVERHRTLHGAVDWSYRLLTPDEQQLFERLSVFAGGFTLEAADRICSVELDGDVTDLLEGLVGKSLVDADLGESETRYSMLETLRQYALAKLVERGDGDRMRDRHLAYFLELAVGAEEGLTGPDELRWVGIVKRELDNFRAAHEWAITSENVDAALRMIVGLQWYGGIRLASEMFDSWAPRALDLPGAEAHEAAPDVYGLSAAGSWQRGELEAARALADRALALAPDPDDPRRIFGLGSLEAVAIFEGRYDEALAHADETLRLARLSGSHAWEAQSLFIRQMIAGYAGNERLVRRYREEARSMSVPLAPSWMAFERYTFGEAVLDDDPVAAIAALDEAVELAERVEQDFLAGVARVGAVSLRGRHFDPDEALAGYAELIESWRRAGNWRQQWTTLRNLLELFARLALDSSAVAVFFAAEASPTAGPVGGAHGARLERLIPELESRLGAEAFAAARERGTRMTDDKAVAFALDEIRAALARGEEASSVS